MISRKSKVQRFDKVIRSGNVGSILTGLFRTIMFGLGIKADRYDALMTRYIQKAQLDINRKERAMVRIGLSKELLKESMSWKTFVKGIKFLGVVEFELRTVLWQADGEVSSHGITVISDDFDLDKVENDEKNPGQLGEILANLYRNIQQSLCTDETQYAAFMEKYLSTYHYKLKKGERATVRAGLTKELGKASITWKTFVKGLSFLGIVKLDLQITLRHSGNKTTKHNIPVVLSEFTPS